MTPAAIIEAFVAAWNRRDRDAVMAAMAEDVVCHGIPLEPAHGKPATAALLAPFFEAEETDWQILHIAEVGQTVLTERVDRFRFGSDFTAVRVAGVFELTDDGLIKAWRDYFDLSELQSALPASANVEPSAGLTDPFEAPAPSPDRAQ